MVQVAMTAFTLRDKSVYKFTMSELAELKENLDKDNQPKRLALIQNAFGCNFERSVYIDNHIKIVHMTGQWPKIGAQS